MCFTPRAAQHPTSPGVAPSPPALRRARTCLGPSDMSSLFGLLGIARTGMTAQTAALETTGQNVSNVSTPGYVRRSAVLANDGAGGVQVTGIARSFDGFTFARLVGEQSKRGAADARSG